MCECVFLLFFIISSLFCSFVMSLTFSFVSFTANIYFNFCVFFCFAFFVCLMGVRKKRKAFHFKLSVFLDFVLVG